MKTSKRICYITALLSSMLLIGCSHPGAPKPANELHFSLDTISDITISYDDEPVTFFMTDDDSLTVKEYMTKDKKKYYANITEKKDSIHISEGGKPLFKGGFSRYIEVYLPVSYSEALTVTTTDGDIDLSDTDLSLSALRIDSTAGTVRISNASASKIHLSSTKGSLELGSILADTIRLETTSGEITCQKLSGDVTYTSTSGNVNIEEAIGLGSYTAGNSGELHVTYAEVTGDLSFFNKNDNIQLTLPQDLDFEFEATTKNGSVSTSFATDLKTDERTSYGTVGNHPTVTVTLETKNGDIEVIQ